MKLWRSCAALLTGAALMCGTVGAVLADPPQPEVKPTNSQGDCAGQLSSNSIHNGVAIRDEAGAGVRSAIVQEVHELSPCPVTVP
jgi:hypothetical protein